MPNWTKDAPDVNSLAQKCPYGYWIGSKIALTNEHFTWARSFPNENIISKEIGIFLDQTIKRGYFCSTLRNLRAFFILFCKK